MFQVKDLFSVKDKVVFITGGDQNIGMAVAKGFAENGAKVVIGNTSREKAEEYISTGKYLHRSGADDIFGGYPDQCTAEYSRL